MDIVLLGLITAMLGGDASAVALILVAAIFLAGAASEIFNLVLSPKVQIRLWSKLVCDASFHPDLRHGARRSAMAMVFDRINPESVVSFICEKGGWRVRPEICPMRLTARLGRPDTMLHRHWS
ncbi:hypothetical protein [Paracoccus aestuarii]|nr:hypothetical protein [Paracoccus aestuarii]